MQLQNRGSHKGHHCESRCEMYLEHTKTKPECHRAQGGEGTQDEMCLAFVLVYPVPRLTVCLSQIPGAELRTFLTEAFTYVLQKRVLTK